MPAASEPVLPAYGDSCVTSLVPALCDPSANWPQWLPADVAQASQVVLFVVDGLGWNQLVERSHLMPTLWSFSGERITTVAPSTTATALTSIATGLAPGEHGVTGYRMSVGGKVLNTLRWTIDGRDARESVRPNTLQCHEPFGGQRPPVLTRAEFRTTGFTRAHLDQTRFIGWRVPSTIVTEIDALLKAKEPFIYAYYDGIDKVAHEYGLGAHYENELRFVDQLIAAVAEKLPADCVMLITSDHGQVDVGDNVIVLEPEVRAHVAYQSGEGRFRWLHARGGRSRALFEDAQRYNDVAWVRTREQIIDEGWFGNSVTEAAASSLGDVALVARTAVSFEDPADTGLFSLVARHGSLTPDEMYVPLKICQS